MADGDVAPVPAWVPLDMRPLLDVGELAPAQRELSEEVEELSRVLRAHVAPYRRGARGRVLGLCSIYEAASLTVAQLVLLREMETRWPAVLFVADAAPLKIRRA